MKKTLSIFLAIVLMFALAIPAFAESPIEDSTGSDEHTVTAQYEANENVKGGNVYYVTIAWDTTDNSLKYSAGTTTYTWDGANMKYEAGTSGQNAGWTGSATVKVTVTNQSNAAITATSDWSSSYNLKAAYSESYAESNKGGAADTTLNDGKVTLGSAAIDAEGGDLALSTEVTGNAQKADITYAITTEGASAITQTGTVGTITLTIAPGTN